MAYDDTNCPCGGQKMRETMLCLECVDATKDTAEARCLSASGMTWEHRRGAAIRLLAMARERRLDRVLTQAAASERFRKANNFR